MPRVLIVDDHPMIVSGCRAMLAGEGDFDVVHAGDAETGFATFLAQKPDISVVDINLPGASGFDLTKRMLRHDAAAKIVIFSMNDDPIFAARAIESGARGYVPKAENPYALVDAIGSVLAGNSFLLPKIADHLAMRNFAPVAAPISSLSARELDILRLLGRGQTMHQIANVMGVSYKTIANSCSIIKSKLNVRTSMELLRIVLDNDLT